jgi:transposase
LHVQSQKKAAERTLMARPTKRTPEREQRLLLAIRAGNTRRAAAAYVGVDERTVERWKQRFAGFADALSRAEAESEVALVAIVRQAATQDWRAAAHLLERRWPDTWGRRERVDVLLRQQAERLASTLEGVTADELIAEAERIVGGHVD